MTLPFSPATRRTAQELVRDTLRRAILTGQIEGGTRLVQQEIAEQLGVSTTPVREALRGLAAEGLIRLDTHKGAVVHQLSQEELEDITQLRCMLEPEALRRAVPQMSEEAIEQAAALQQAMDDEEDPAHFAELNRRFHRIFIDAAGSERLAQILELLQDSYGMYIVTSMMHDPQRMVIANRQHLEMVEAARDRDVDRAQRVMLEHMRETLNHVETMHPGPT